MLSMLVVYALGLVGLLLLLIFQVPTTISQIPLTYNVIYGVTYASSWFGIYGYLGALIVLGIANFMIAWAYFDKERLLSYLAACVTLILVALMILFTYNLTALVV